MQITFTDSVTPKKCLSAISLTQLLLQVQKGGGDIVIGKQSSDVEIRAITATAAFGYAGYIIGDGVTTPTPQLDKPVWWAGDLWARAITVPAELTIIETTDPSFLSQPMSNSIPHGR